MLYESVGCEVETLVLHRRGSFSIEKRRTITTSYYSPRWSKTAKCEVHCRIVILLAPYFRSLNNPDYHKLQIYVLQQYVAMP